MALIHILNCQYGAYIKVYHPGRKLVITVFEDMHICQSNNNGKRLIPKEIIFSTNHGTASRKSANIILLMH